MQLNTSVILVAATVLSSTGAWAGAGSSSSLGGAGSGLGGVSSSTADAELRLQKINRHAIKSAILVRQLLAQNGVPGMSASK